MACTLPVAACGGLVPWPGMEPRSPALRTGSLSHCTTREASAIVFDFLKIIGVLKIYCILKQDFFFFALTQKNIFSLKKHKYAFVSLTRKIVAYPVSQEYYYFCCISQVAQW